MRAPLLVMGTLLFLTREMPHATRLLGLVPVAALFAACGTTRLLAPLSKVLSRSALRGAVAGLVLAVIALNSYQYFVVEAYDPQMLDFTGRTLCEYIRQLDGVDVYWTEDIGFWAGGQCLFLGRGRYTDNDLTVERARNPASLRHERPVVAVVWYRVLGESPRRDRTRYRWPSHARLPGRAARATGPAGKSTVLSVPLLSAA